MERDRLHPRPQPKQRENHVAQVMEPRPPKTLTRVEQVPAKLKPVAGEPGMRLLLLCKLRVERHELQHR